MGSGELLSFFVVTQGQLGVELPERGLTELVADQVVVLDWTDPLLLRHEAGAPLEPLSALRGDICGSPPRLTLDGLGDPGEGLYGVLHHRHYLFNPLSRVLSSPSVLSGVGGWSTWAGSSLSVLVDEREAERPGGTGLIDRMIQMLFIDVIRSRVGEPGIGGWLGALGDPSLARALELIHGDPGYSWTNSELGRRCGLHRKELVERFQGLMELTPLQYLRLWRMELAAQQLAVQAGELSALAERLGFPSQRAFEAVFEAHFDAGPEEWMANEGASLGAPLGSP